MSKNCFGKVLCGVVIGACLGVLFAPKSGKETREELKKSINNLIDSLKNVDKEDVKKAIINKINEVRNLLEELDKETILENAQKLAITIKTKLSELKDIVVTNTTPYIEKFDMEFRKNTINILNKTIKKLEKNS